MKCILLKALIKANKPNERTRDYVIMEDVAKGWDKKHETSTQQRILDDGEKVLEAQSRWKGNGKFILKKKNNVSNMLTTLPASRVGEWEEPFIQVFK